MNDLPVVDMLHAQTNLCEHVQYLVFWQQSTTLLFQKLRQIASIGIVHHDAELAFWRSEYLNEPNDVRMLQVFDDLGLLESFFLVILTHLFNVNGFEDAQDTVYFSLDQKCFSE